MAIGGIIAIVFMLMASLSSMMFFAPQLFVAKEMEKDAGKLRSVQVYGGLVIIAAIVMWVLYMRYGV